MARPKTQGPTERELEILQTLWDKGPSTTKDVQAHLNEHKDRDTAYNSVATILSIMLDKGLVSRDESQRNHIYSAVYSKVEMEKKLVTTFVNSVFGGSALRLVTRALELNPSSQEDQEKIAKLLEDMKN